MKDEGLCADSPHGAITRRRKSRVSVEVIRNSREGDEAPISPVHADGTRFPYAMHFDGAKYVGFADSPTELLGLLIPDYEEMDPQEQQVARIRLAVNVQVAVQAQINAEAMSSDAWDDLSDEERAILNGPRFEQPHGWGDPDEMGDVWDSEIPLVVVETGYAPYTSFDRPISGIADVLDPPNMVWLRPVEEFEFLSSMANTGYIDLYEATDI
jgi:hypothetical protein